MKYTSVAFVLATLFIAALTSNMVHVGAEGSDAWDARSAAAYLDARQAWWRNWPTAARDHDTACVSCHSALPYALARPALRSRLNESGPSVNESKLLADVVKRVRAWKDMEPWYPDQTRGLPKTAESRGTESVINAIVLSRRDAADGALSADGRQAFANMWAQQMRTGDLTGAWAWLSFKLEPWEGAQSAYFGATLAAVAIGSAPGGYASSGDIEKNVELLRVYLRKNARDQHTLNKLMFFWRRRS
jgi:squalene-hopene/tetraprenyl-beta-curcumene cyclase